MVELILSSLLRSRRSPAPAHAPLDFLNPAHRSAPLQSGFGPLRFPLRSRSAHMLWQCEANVFISMDSCMHVIPQGNPKSDLNAWISLKRPWRLVHQTTEELESENFFACLLVRFVNGFLWKQALVVVLDMVGQPLALLSTLQQNIQLLIAPWRLWAPTIAGAAGP